MVLCFPPIRGRELEREREATGETEITDVKKIAKTGQMVSRQYLRLVHHKPEDSVHNPTLLWIVHNICNCCRW